jgi:hypothetical protein
MTSSEIRHWEGCSWCHALRTVGMRLHDLRTMFECTSTARTAAETLSISERAVEPAGRAHIARVELAAPQWPKACRSEWRACRHALSKLLALGRIWWEGNKRSATSAYRTRK